MQSKIWLFAAALLVIVGLIVFAAVMWELDWDFTKLSTGKYEKNTYEIGDSFSNIAVYTDTADIVFLLSQDGKCKIECYEEEKARHSVKLEEGTLTVRLTDERTWTDRIGIFFESPKITVHLPENQYKALLVQESTGDVTVSKDLSFDTVNISVDTGDVSFSASTTGQVKVNTSTGDICIENASAGELDLSVSTGKITVSNVTCQGDMNVQVSTGKTVLTDVACKNLTSKGSTGGITLNQVIAEEMISIERSTGDIRFNSSDALAISVETNTGDVTGNLLTGKYFVVETDTGRINVPRETEGGRCEISTGTGDIKITIP